MRFDLSSLQLPHGAPSARCAPCEAPSHAAVDSSVDSSFDSSLGASGQNAHFSFSLGAPRRLVRRVIPTLKRITSSNSSPKCSRGDDPENDQYTIKPGRSMCWAVLCRNDTGRSHPNSLLGDFGHLERMSAWVHLLGGLLFLFYSISRPFLITVDHTIAETLTTVAAGGIAFAFLSSTVYHVTAPDQNLAKWSRQLDFFGIYTGLALAAVSDFCIATRGFSNVSVLAVADAPIACAVTAAFFVSRRFFVPVDDSWKTYLGGCTLSFGLLRRAHLDLAHTGARQATSFLLSVSYFVTVPSLYSNFGAQNATTILVLELLCLALVVFGMAVDNLWTFPDKSLANGKGPDFLVCKRCGCVGNSHAIWHVLTVIAAVKGASSREFALSLQR